MRFVFVLSDNDVYSGWPWNPGVRGGQTLQIHDVILPAPAVAELETRIFRDRGKRFDMVEPDGIEPTTSCLQSTRSTN